MRFDGDVNQRRESGCDEDGENNSHLTTLKLVFMLNHDRFGGVGISAMG
jgi:hypothetical protein